MAVVLTFNSAEAAKIINKRKTNRDDISMQTETIWSSMHQSKQFHSDRQLKFNILQFKDGRKRLILSANDYHTFIMRLSISNINNN